MAGLSLNVLALVVLVQPVRQVQPVLQVRVRRWDLPLLARAARCTPPARSPVAPEPRVVRADRRAQALHRAHVLDSQHVPVWAHVLADLRVRLPEPRVRRLRACVPRVRASVAAASVTRR